MTTIPRANFPKPDMGVSHVTAADECIVAALKNHHMGAIFKVAAALGMAGVARSTESMDAVPSPSMDVVASPETIAKRFSMLFSCGTLEPNNSVNRLDNLAKLGFFLGAAASFHPTH
jgi:hypothetical protein